METLGSFTEEPNKASPADTLLRWHKGHYQVRLQNLQSAFLRYMEEAAPKQTALLLQRYDFSSQHDYYAEPWDSEELSQLRDTLDEFLAYISAGNHPVFEALHIPRVLTQRSTTVRNWLQDQLADVPNQHLLGWLQKHHEVLKVALHQWLLGSNGHLIEPFLVSPEDHESLAPHYGERYLPYLARFGIHPGDLVLQRHIISRKGRARYASMGFSVQSPYWEESYFAEALNHCHALIEDNPRIKAVVSDGSWIYDPALLNTQYEGSPLVRCSWLDEDLYVPYRHELFTPDPNDDQFHQYTFATKASPRRKRASEAGLYTPKAYAVVYPSSLLDARIKEIQERIDPELRM